MSENYKTIEIQAIRITMITLNWFMVAKKMILMEEKLDGILKYNSVA